MARVLQTTAKHTEDRENTREIRTRELRDRPGQNAGHCLQDRSYNDANEGDSEEISESNSFC